MSESSERKIKLLLLYEILRKQTDERHPMTTGELSDALQNFGIAVSRSGVYQGILSSREIAWNLYKVKLIRRQGNEKVCSMRRLRKKTLQGGAGFRCGTCLPEVQKARSRNGKRGRHRNA